MDAHTNFAYSTVAVAPAPAATGLSLTIAAGTAALFPTAPFNCTVWVSGSEPLSSNAEIIRVTAVVGDTFTIVRAQEGTVARAILVTDQIAASITVKTITDVEDAISIVSAQVAINSAQMTSADNALAAAINVVSNAASNALSVANAVSNRLSTWRLDDLANVSAPAPTDQQALVFNSAQAQWVASTIAAGAGSVTSAELQAVSAAAASADATLSGRIDSVNTVVSNLASAVVANSAQMTSADNALSAAVNVVSNALSAEIVNRISADAVLSGRIDSTNTVVSNLISDVASVKDRVSAVSALLSNAISAIVANSAQMTSADAALSVRIDTNSAQMTSADNANSAAAAAVSVRLNSTNTVVSNQGSAIVANSAQMTSADGALSVRIDTNSAQMTSADNAISAAVAAVSVRLNSTNTVVSNQGSAIVANSAQMTSADNAISAAAAAVSVRLNSTNTVVSNQGSAIVANSAQMTSADNAISAVAAAALSVANAVSNRLSTWTLDNLANVSVPSPGDGQVVMFNSAANQWVASAVAVGTGSVTSAELSAAIASVQAQMPIRRALADNQIVSVTALAVVSGFNFTVSGGQAYKFEFLMIHSVSTSLGMPQFAFSAPSTAAGFYAKYWLDGAVGALGQTAQTVFITQGVRNSANQTTSVVGARRGSWIQGQFFASANGTAVFNIGNGTSGDSAQITLMAGSYGLVWRMS